MAVDQHWLVTVALVTSSLIAVVANLLLLLVFCRRRGLRTISNRFTINLLLTNLLSSILLVPLLIIDQQVASSSNLTTYHTAESLETQNVIIQIQNISAPNEIILQEEKEEEIVESDLFERTEKFVISDKFKLAIFATNKSDTVEENISSNVSELTYLSNKEAEEDNGYLNKILCYVAQSTVGLVCTASILSVLLIGIDQYFAVIHSLRYHSYIDKFRSMALIITSWIISVLFGIFGALTQTESNLWHFCMKHATGIEHNPQLQTLNSVYALMYFIFVILTPFLAICIIYVCIYAAARNNSERMRKSTKGNSHSNLDSYMQVPNDKKAPSESRLDMKANSKEENEVNSHSSSTQKGLHKVQSAPNFSNLINAQEKESTSTETPHVTVKRTCSERVGFISNLKYKISNASVFRYREESRAAKISILVIFMVLVCYTPYGLAIILNSHAVGITTPQLYNFISLVLLVLSNIISPFLFAYRNRRIRRELLKFLGVAPARNPSLLVRRSIVRPNSVLPTAEQRHKMIEEECEKTEMGMAVQPFLANASAIPQVIITCKVESEKAEKTSILKRVCSGKNWQSYKKCTFITVPESCWQTDSARGSFSSASTQISTED